jgi:hypothetical protein
MAQTSDIRKPCRNMTSNKHRSSTWFLLPLVASINCSTSREVRCLRSLTSTRPPIEEKNFPTDYRELQSLLARRLDPCDAIVHLVGFYYGGRAEGTTEYSASILDAMGILPCGTGRAPQTGVPVPRPRKLSL